MVFHSNLCPPSVWRARPLDPLNPSNLSNLFENELHIFPSTKSEMIQILIINAQFYILDLCILIPAYRFVMEISRRC